MWAQAALSRQAILTEALILLRQEAVHLQARDNQGHLLLHITMPEAILFLQGEALRTADQDTPPGHLIAIHQADHPHIADPAQVQETIPQDPLLQDHQGHQVLHPAHPEVHLAVLHPEAGDSLNNDF